MASFGDYFKESMDSMGLPVPRSGFETWISAQRNVTGILVVVQQFGTKVTVAELLLTAPKAASVVFLKDIAIVAGGVTAAFYAGACVGAFVYALQRSAGLDALSLSNKLDDILNSARKSGVIVPRGVAMQIVSQQA